METKKISPLVLLLLVSCSTVIQSPKVERTTASVESSACNDIIQDLFKAAHAIIKGEKSPGKLSSIGMADDGIIDSAELEKLVEEYGMASDAPEEMKTAFQGLYNGKMSLSVFKDLSKEFPNVQGTVSALIFKDHLSALNVAQPKSFAADGKAQIKMTLDHYKMSYSIKKETKDYYLIDIPISEAKDAKFLGMFSALTPIQPIVYAKDGAIPTNRFFKLPDSVIQKMEEQIHTQDADVRYSFVQMLRKGNITLDAATSLINHNDSSVVKIDFHVSKSSLEVLKDQKPAYFTGDFRDIETALTKSNLDGSFKKLSETSDTVTYQISIKSKEDMANFYQLQVMAVQGKFSLSN